ncbi:hypothetical protein HAX54_012278, partial [Datura stramonium]|nr:hypothetical protein [Datura stramonium]
ELPSEGRRILNLDQMGSPQIRRRIIDKRQCNKHRIQMRQLPSKFNDPAEWTWKRMKVSPHMQSRKTVVEAVHFPNLLF